MSDPSAPIGLPLDLPPGLQQRLLKAWSAPERGYHDLRHLREVLDRLDDLAAAGTAFDRTAVELAAWFHDAVHEGSPSDETRSAALAVTELSAAGVGPDVVQEVERLILLTIRHDPEEGDLNGAALCDADLGILAASPQRYAEYVAGVRVEYAHYDDATFGAGRMAVLEQLARGALFRTDHGRLQWEPTARGNLTREVQELRASLDA